MPQCPSRRVQLHMLDPLLPETLRLSNIVVAYYALGIILAVEERQEDQRQED